MGEEGKRRVEKKGGEEMHVYMYSVREKEGKSTTFSLPLLLEKLRGE